MKIGIIGVGNIGSIIVNRLTGDGVIEPENVVIYNRTLSKIEKYKEKGITIAVDNENLCELSDVIFLCVKPQDAQELFEQIKNVDFSGKIVVSTMTGIEMCKIKDIIGAEKVVRIMPNVPSAIGKGVIGITFSKSVNNEDKKLIWRILSPLGKLVEVKEKHFAAVTALSGSGPAFVFVIIEALIDAGIKLGLSYDVTRELVLETLKGSTELLQARGNHPGEFRHLVTSPAGTTIEGIYSLEREGIRGILMKAIFDTYKRAVELENEIRNKS